MAQKHDITLTPSIVLLDKDNVDKGIRFNGIPAGHEINSFITGLIEVSGNDEKISKELKSKIDKIYNKVNIKVFVTLSCPHCSGAVAKAHKLALENENITAEMVECSTFPDLADKFIVSGVPKIVFNDNETHSLLGNQPFDQFVNILEKL